MFKFKAMASSKYNLREQSKNRYSFIHKTQNWAKNRGENVRNVQNVFPTPDLRCQVFWGFDDYGGSMEEN